MPFVATCPCCATAVEIADQPEVTSFSCPTCGKEFSAQSRKVRHSWGFSRGLLTSGVFAVVAITLLGLTIIAVWSVRQQNARTATLHNLRVIAKGAHDAHDTFKKFPPYSGTYGACRIPLTFHTHLLQFVGEPLLYETIAFGADGGKIPHHLESASVPAYISPMDSTLHSGGAGACNFPVNIRLYYSFGGAGNLRVLHDPAYPRMPRDFPDGTSNTLLLATKYMLCGNGGSRWADPHGYAPSATAATFGANMGLWQAAPVKEKCDPLQGTAQSFRQQDIQVAMCDGSVRSVSINISPATWQAVHTPGGNDPIGADWDN
jgi:hypothetical protein